MSSTDVAIIGVGPNGLSVAAHLRQAGVEYRAFGLPMGAWRFNMPAGMRLKSEPYASDLSAPSQGFLARDYCNQAGEVYPERVNPLNARAVHRLRDLVRRRARSGHRRDRSRFAGEATNRWLLDPYRE